MFVVLLVLGAPIGYTLFASSLLYIVIENLPLSVGLQRMIAGVYNFPLLAIPFFVLAGNLMNVGGITKRIFRFADVCVGHIPGGLGHVNVFASVIFAGMSGSAVADAAGLGVVEIQAMREAGYDLDFSVAITAASSVIGPIIPPSIIMVVYSVFSGASLGRMLVSGLLPGLLMGVVLSIMVYFHSKKKNYSVRKRVGLKEFLTVTADAAPALMTPVILVCGIIFGIFTPTEAATVAALYALILGFITHGLQIQDIPKILTETIHVTANITWIIACSSLFGWVLTHMSVANTLVSAFQGSISNKFIAIIVLNICLLIVGVFMDNSAAVPIFTPVLVPVAVSYGLDPVHFGLIMVLNLILGLLTPPVGMVLFTLAGMNRMTVLHVARITFPYLIGLIVLLYIISFVPQIALFLPNLIYGNQF
jgi:tripartite ATP-independent transporter DctM subunit